MREAARLHQSQARQKALDLRVKLPARAVDVYLDHTALVRILDLLIGNAVKYRRRARSWSRPTRTTNASR